MLAERTLESIERIRQGLRRQPLRAPTADPGIEEHAVLVHPYRGHAARKEHEFYRAPNAADCATVFRRKARKGCERATTELLIRGAREVAMHLGGGDHRRRSHGLRFDGRRKRFELWDRLGTQRIGQLTDEPEPLTGSQAPA